MQLIIFLLCLLFFSASAKDYINATRSEVTSIYDADIFCVNLKGCLPKIGERAPVRIPGIDTPKIRGKRQAKKIKSCSNA